MWIWDDRINEWVWVEKQNRMGPLQVILAIVVAFFLIYVLFPQKSGELLEKWVLLFAVTPQPTQAVQQGPVYVVVTATPQSMFDVNPEWKGPLPTKHPQPSIQEWNPGMPLPKPMGPPAP